MPGSPQWAHEDLAQSTFWNQQKNAPSILETHFPAAFVSSQAQVFDVLEESFTRASRLSCFNSLVPACALHFHTPCEPSPSSSTWKSFPSSIGPRPALHKARVIRSSWDLELALTKRSLGMPGRVGPLVYLEGELSLQILFWVVYFELTFSAWFISYSAPVLLWF
jgi:hypothetical protein